MRRTIETREYDRRTSVVFYKTKEEYGGLSNMASGFPFQINGMEILTSEALYQACRFPHLPDVQREIIEQKSPMTAKMKSRRYGSRSRDDWIKVRVAVMRWCLRVKLASNPAEFRGLLLGTGDRPIVEESRRDVFWGAKVTGGRTLVGANVLGRLLMELREEIRRNSLRGIHRVEPPRMENFLIGGRPVGAIETAPSRLQRGLAWSVPKPGTAERLTPRS